MKTHKTDNKTAHKTAHKTAYNFAWLFWGGILRAKNTQKNPLKIVGSFVAPIVWHIVRRIV
jgi:hypothetical protein